MSTTTTYTGNSVLAVAPAVFPTVFVSPDAGSSNTNETSTDNARPVVDNPSNWPTGFRRVPNYRPANTNLDLAERPYGASRIGWLVGHFLMTGVMVQSVSDIAFVHTNIWVKIWQSFTKTWEATGYRWSPGLTRHDIGGEW